MADGTSLPALLFVVLILRSPLECSSHYSTYPAPSSSFSPYQSDWKLGRATYYAATEPRESVGGACGYGDLSAAGYGMATAGLSESLFDRGSICGACFQIRCINDIRWCIPGTSITVTATNFCPPNYSFGVDAGGVCNPPNRHFVLPIEAFEKIAIWKASNMPVQYRRIKCRKLGGIRFTVGGSGAFFSTLISNVGGSGDVTAVKVKGSRTGWLQMARNWGQNWHVSANLIGQPVSFELTTRDGLTLTSYNALPQDWRFGQSFEGRQFPAS